MRTGEGTWRRLFPRAQGSYPKRAPRLHVVRVARRSHVPVARSPGRAREGAPGAASGAGQLHRQLHRRANPVFFRAACTLGRYANYVRLLWLCAAHVEGRLP